HSFWSQGTSIGVLAAWGVAGVIVAAYTFGWEPRSA
ncbi:MAG: ABC transporter permease, partial [Actinobacteria bacterium]|nr:ABC transporter permease [Actinomycetota bacterium]